MRARILLLAFLIANLSLHGGEPGKSPADPRALAKRYLAAREATMQEWAGAAEVEAVVAQCAESVVYEHPRAGIRLSGVEPLRSGMTRFLGSTRRARIRITATLPGKDMIAARTRVSFEAKDGDKWSAVEREQVWVFEFRNNAITRIMEYW